jgi:hypothetical protein
MSAQAEQIPAQLDIPNLEELKVVFDEVSFDFNRVMRFGIDVFLAGGCLKIAPTGNYCQKAMQFNKSTGIKKPAYFTTK